MNVTAEREVNSEDQNICTKSQKQNSDCHLLPRGKLDLHPDLPHALRIYLNGIVAAASQPSPSDTRV